MVIYKQTISTGCYIINLILPGTESRARGIGGAAFIIDSTSVSTHNGRAPVPSIPTPHLLSSPPVLHHSNCKGTVNLAFGGRGRRVATRLESGWGRRILIKRIGWGVAVG